MTLRDTPSRASWLRPGIWVRCKLSPHWPRAFVLFVTDGGFKYHFEKPFHMHSREEGWHTGGEVFPAGMEGWEPAEAVPSETKRTGCARCGAETAEQCNDKGCFFLESGETSLRRTCPKCGVSWNAPVNLCPECGTEGYPGIAHDLERLRTAATTIRNAFTYDPGHSDLDDEQPIHISTTLGAWRNLNYVIDNASAPSAEQQNNALAAMPPGRDQRGAEPGQPEPRGTNYVVELERELEESKDAEARTRERLETVLSARVEKDDPAAVLLREMVELWDEQQSKHSQSIADEPWDIKQARRLLASPRYVGERPTVEDALKLYPDRAEHHEAAAEDRKTRKP